MKGLEKLIEREDLTSEEYRAILHYREIYKALEFYADSANYYQPVASVTDQGHPISYQSHVQSDAGAYARKALEAYKI